MNKQIQIRYQATPNGVKIIKTDVHQELAALLIKAYLMAEETNTPNFTAKLTSVY